MKGKRVLVFLSLAVFLAWGNAHGSGPGVRSAGNMFLPAVSAGDYIVTEISPGKVSAITPGGARTVIYDYGTGYGGPRGLAIDSAANYIVTESSLAPEWEWSSLSSITPGGVRNIIYPGTSYGYYDAVAIDGSGNYIVASAGTLSKITPGGVKTVIYNYNGASGAWPSGVAIDGAGNYIVTETFPDGLAKITPGGVRTPIYSFASLAWPSAVAIDSAGNYIVAESAVDILSKITPGGVRTKIYTFAPGAEPHGVAIDSAGNYIVAERMASVLSKIDPSGVRTVIYSFASGTNLWDVAVVPGATAGYDATIWGWDYVQGWISVPITMDGIATGYSTPHTFTGLNGTHTFTVPSTNSFGDPFSDWDTGLTDKTITVTGAGTFTARYRAGYSATVWSWDYIQGWLAEPITMDGVATGYSTPHTFTDLTGTHTFTVPSTNAVGDPFSDWSTGWTGSTITVTEAGTFTARYRAGYSATIWSWDYLQGWLAEPITMDGVVTGYSTPHTFTGLTGNHTFSVPSTNPFGNPFSDWDTGWTDKTITVTGAGTFTARYRAGYSATIWSWCATDAWLSSPITMDGVSTGYNTPHTFSGLTGTHTFTVPSNHVSHHKFYEWSTGSTGITLSVSEAGVYTARYKPTKEKPAIDFDGDGNLDMAVWRPASGIWYVLPSGSPGSYTQTQWGLPTDQPVPADYDGDGKVDIAVWRPATGIWYIRPSSSPGSYTQTQWGLSTDQPIPADYDGDGKVDIAVWRPATGIWYIRPTNSPGSYTQTQWGLSTDKPVPADYDGDGNADLTVWRSSSGVWWVLPSASPGTYTSTQWGLSTDKPLPGDYDGDGKTDIAVWRPSGGMWYVLPSGSPGTYTAKQWGISSDIPIPGDYDGDGKMDCAVYRPDTGTWYALLSGSPGGYSSLVWGLSGDVPISALTMILRQVP